MHRSPYEINSEAGPTCPPIFFYPNSAPDRAYWTLQISIISLCSQKNFYSINYISYHCMNQFWKAQHLPQIFLAHNKFASCSRVLILMFLEICISMVFEFIPILIVLISQNWTINKMWIPKWHLLYWALFWTCVVWLI